ncbi:MAG: O-antigen ligase family protein, partial [Ginsengibacter sp.]
MDYFIIGLITISLFDFARTFINNEVPEIFQEFAQLISLFLGYFIIKNWISHNKTELVIKFLFSLVIINSIASILFILHQGLNLRIYLEEEYLKESFEGVEISRSFYFMPQFLFFSITFLLVFKEKYPLLYRPLLIINLLAVFITYTRSYVIIIALIFLLYFLLMGIKKGKIGLIFKNIFLYSLLALFGIFILSKIFPVKSKYFMDRFTELSTPSTTQDPNNLQYRFMRTGNIISSMGTDKKIFGMGPVTANQYSSYAEMGFATSDMVWAGVIFRWGFAGLALFILLYIFSLIYTFRFFMRSDGILSYLALFLFIYIFSQIVESFVS